MIFYPLLNTVIEMKRRRGKRHKQLLNDLKETSGYWKLKEETLDRILWGTRFRRCYGPSLRETTHFMNGYDVKGF